MNSLWDKSTTLKCYRIGIYNDILTIKYYTFVNAYEMSVHREMNNRMRYMEEIHFHSTHALHIPVKMKRNDYYPQNASKVKCIKISPLLQLCGNSDGSRVFVAPQLIVCFKNVESNDLC